MTAGRGVRTLRAVVFAAVCVLLAALGHLLMSGFPVPWWTTAAGFAATAGAGWCLAGRERGLPLVLSVAVLAQGALHRAFALTGGGSADPSAGTSGAGGAGTGGGGAAGLMGGVGHAAHMGHAAHPGPAAHLGLSAHPGHGTDGGSSSLGMLAAHTLAALLSGLWLGHGERAAFRVLRAVAGWLAAPLRRPAAATAVPAPRPGPGPSRERTVRVPRPALAHTIVSRGPPAGTAVVRDSRCPEPVRLFPGHRTAGARAGGRPSGRSRARRHVYGLSPLPPVPGRLRGAHRAAPCVRHAGARPGPPPRLRAPPHLPSGPSVSSAGRRVPPRRIPDLPTGHPGDHFCSARPAHDARRGAPVEP
ncbi:hypothetical protein [Streptomyces brasiliscabiei]|uniref:hypothetical protein n=1 Tax=Streptomyces brasiliscabiei TaxID=2736302 RepID=UPI0027BA6482|nr:hypothetical protein [Streptomyces brasiliscabiei]